MIMISSTCVSFIKQNCTKANIEETSANTSKGSPASFAISRNTSIQNGHDSFLRHPQDHSIRWLCVLFSIPSYDYVSEISASA